MWHVKKGGLIKGQNARSLTVFRMVHSRTRIHGIRWLSSPHDDQARRVRIAVRRLADVASHGLQQIRARLSGVARLAIIGLDQGSMQVRMD